MCSLVHEILLKFRRCGVREYSVFIEDQQVRDEILGRQYCRRFLIDIGYPRLMFSDRSNSLTRWAHLADVRRAIFFLVKLVFFSVCDDISQRHFDEIFHGFQGFSHSTEWVGVKI